MRVNVGQGRALPKSISHTTRYNRMTQFATEPFR
jgi:hypothetical protein